MRAVALFVVSATAAAFVPLRPPLCVWRAAAASVAPCRTCSAARAAAPRLCAADDPFAVRAATVAMLERCLLVANLEDRIAECERLDDLEGAVEAYEELLELQPVDDASLSAESADRRGLQELLLESARSELAARCAEDAVAEGCPTFLEQTSSALAAVGEAYRKAALRRALDDVGRLRASLVRFFDEATRQAELDAQRACGDAGAPDAVLAGARLDEATRRGQDSQLLRKFVEADLSRLELQLLAGDPSLAFLRSELARALQQGGLPEGAVPAALADTVAPPPPPKSLWLAEQLEAGALPRDPQLLRCLLEQARRDPQMVERLVTRAKDARGEDIYTRRENDPSAFGLFS